MTGVETAVSDSRSTIVGKTLLEAFARIVDAAFDSAEGQRELLGDFFIFITGDMHRERFAIVGRKLVDGYLNFSCTVAVFG